MFLVKLSFENEGLVGLLQLKILHGSKLFTVVKRIASSNERWPYQLFLLSSIA